MGSRIKKTEWLRICIRCDKSFKATGKGCKVCSKCNTNIGCGLKLEQDTKENLNDIIKNFKDSGRIINYNILLKGYIKLTKDPLIKEELRKVIFGNKKKS